MDLLTLAMMKKMQGVSGGGSGGGDSSGGGDEMFISVMEKTVVNLELPEGLVTLALSLSRVNTMTGIVFPSTLETLTGSCFAYCTGLESEIVFPASLKTIETKAFYGSWKIPSVTFKGTPTTIASDAFGGCTKLTTINVPWAEGAVADAPWGATNATINYNYVG